MEKKTWEYFQNHPGLWEEIFKAALIKYCEEELDKTEEENY